jgi:hypothetical protein
MQRLWTTVSSGERPGRFRGRKSRRLLSVHFVLTRRRSNQFNFAQHADA